MKAKDFVYEPADVHALKAMAKGTANSAQQQRALAIFFNVTGLRDMPSVTDNPLELAFNEGRRLPGWHIAKLIELVGVTADLPTKKEA